MLNKYQLFLLFIYYVILSTLHMYYVFLLTSYILRASYGLWAGDTPTINCISNTPFSYGFYCFLFGFSNNKPSNKILVLTQACTQETIVLGL